MNRGRGRQQVFHDVKYYEYFLSCLEQAHKRFGVETHAYCLMGNHYHLLVRTPRGNLSRAMRHINGVYKGSGVDNTGRAMAMKLCQESRSIKLAEIGKLFGMGSDSGVTKAVTRLTQRMAEDERVRGVYNGLCQDLSP